jgi:hypothetical protein
MTSWGLVQYFGQMYGMPLERLNTKMNALFDRFQMNEIRDVLCSKMSTGMKRKVSIVRAMIHNPPVLIFDEATSGLDILVAREVLKAVKHIMRERRSLPSLGSAILCGVVILVEKFFVGFSVTAPQNFGQFAFQTVIILVATIFIPSVMMALFLTRNPKKSLRLNGCKITMAAAAVLGAISLNPAFT